MHVADTMENATASSCVFPSSRNGVSQNVGTCLFWELSIFVGTFWEGLGRHYHVYSSIQVHKGLLSQQRGWCWCSSTFCRFGPGFLGAYWVWESWAFISHSDINRTKPMVGCFTYRMNLNIYTNIYIYKYTFIYIIYYVFEAYIVYNVWVIVFLSLVGILLIDQPM